jgi:hypothetical protein
LASDEDTETNEIGPPELLAMVITTAEFPWTFAAVTVTCEMTMSLLPAEAPGAKPTDASAIAKHDASSPRAT